MRLSNITPAIVMLFVLLFAVWAAPSLGGEMSAAQAGEIARQQTGGRVLAIKPADGGFQVKVLTPDGKVRYVFVPSR